MSRGIAHPLVIILLHTTCNILRIVGVFESDFCIGIGS